MPKWLSAVIGAAEIAGGAVLMATGVGGPAGAALLNLGIGTEISGLGTLFSKGPMQGSSTALRNPIAPREVGYGQNCSGGSLIWARQFGSNNKYVDMVFDLCDFVPTKGVRALMIDRQVVQIDTTAVPAGVPASTYPYINGGMSFTPVQQQGMNLYWIERVGSTVTLVTDGSDGGHGWGDIPLLQAGDFILVDSVPSGDGHVPGNSTVNGRYPVQTVTHYSPSDPRYPTPSGYSGAQKSGTYCKITYTSGGVATAVFKAGHLNTQWPTYGSRIYMEVMTGSQTLGQTFVGLRNGTPDPGNIHGGAAITYENQGYGPSPWTANHSGVGCTLVHLRFYWDQKELPYIPQISFIWDGNAHVYDPRTSTYGYTENAALCINDFLCSPVYGYNMTLGVDVSTADIIAAANICDETVSKADASTEARYACDGRFNLSMARVEILQNLLTSCSGRIRESTNGLVLQAAKWAGGATAAPGLANMAGAIEWAPVPSITERYNGVKGTYIWPGNNWQPSDFPPYAQDTTHDPGGTLGYGTGGGGYSDENLVIDGGLRRWLDIQLPFEISPSRAQRHAKIELMRRRQFGSGVFRYNLLGYSITALDIITESVPFFGWTGKEFEAQHVRLLPDPKGYRTEVAVQETDSSVYDWSPSEELSPAALPQIAAPSVLNPLVPTEVTLLSDSTTAFVDASGVAHSRILVTWTAPVDGFVLSGGHIELQYQVVGDTTWISLPSVDDPANITSAYISNVKDGVSYNVQVRSVNANGVPSAWVPAGPVTVSGSIAGLSVFGPNGGNFYPVYADALYPQAMFGVTPNYEAAADGSQLSAIDVAPTVPANTFSAIIAAPTVSPTVTYASTGGSIPGGASGFIALVGQDSGGAFTKLSNIVPFSVPTGTNTNTLTFTPTYDIATALLLIYVGNSQRSLTYRRNNSTGGSTITLTSLLSVTGDSYGMPDPNFDHFVIGTVKVLLVGSAGGKVDPSTGAGPLVVSAVAFPGGGSVKLTITGAAFTPSAFVGRVLGWIEQGFGNPTPLQNYTITANDATSITVHPTAAPLSWNGPSPQFQLGDKLVVMLSPAVGGGGTTVSDSLLAMGADDYAGKVLRLFYADGTNESSFITTNSATTCTVQDENNFTLPSTPLFWWIEEGSFSAMTPATAAAVNAYTSSGIALVAPIDNIAAFVAVQLFASDVNGNLSPPQYSPMRLTWWPGQTGASVFNPGYQILAPDVSNNVTIDLAMGLNFRLVLTSAMESGSPVVSLLTILAPIRTGGAIAAGLSFYLYIGQDSTGNHPPPALDNGTNGFTTNASDKILGIGGGVNEWTYLQFTFHGTKWGIDVIVPGISLT